MLKRIILVAAACLLPLAIAVPAQATYIADTDLCGTGALAQVVVNLNNNDNTWNKQDVHEYQEKGYCAFGNDGNDSMTADWNADYLFGGNGNDTLNGYVSFDTLNGNAGADTLDGGPGDDVYYGGNGDDYMQDSDTVGGDDNFFGGGICDETNYWGYWNYDETYEDTRACSTANSGADEIWAGPGNDWIWESNSDIYGDGNVDDIHGQGGNDVCIVEAVFNTDGTVNHYIDTFAGCEDVRPVPTNPNL